MSRRESDVQLQSPILFSADDRLVDSIPDRSEVSFPASNFPYIGFDGGARSQTNVEPSEVLYSYSHLLERPTKLLGPHQSRVGIIQSFQIKPASPPVARQLSPVPEASRKTAPDDVNGAGAKTVRSYSQTSLNAPMEQSPSSSSTSPTSAAQADKYEHSNGKEGPFPLPQGPSRFEDVETSSILSMEELTETLNELPAPNLVPHGNKSTSSRTTHTTPLPAPVSAAHRELTPSLPHDAHDANDSSTPTDNGSVASLNHSPSSIPAVTLLPSMPSHIQPGKVVGTDPSSPASSHAWHSFQFTRNAYSHPETPGTLLPLPPTSTSPGEVTEEQLSAAMKAKAHLEGQLESVVEECKALLQDRAELQSKMARTEAALREAERRSQEQSKTPRSGTVLEGRDGPVKEELRQVSAALQREQQLAASVQEALGREKDAKQKLLNELTQCKRKLASQEPVLKSAQDQCAALQAHLEQKSKEKEGVDGRLVAAEARLKTLEESKLWLHNKLDDALNLTMKLQNEVRDSKTAALAHSMRADQLRKENASLQSHIAELHQGMMRDKEALVGQLEAIEADVLSREEACEQLAASRLQIEDMVRGKAEEIETLTNKLAESEMQRGELGEELAEARLAIEQITQNGLKEKNSLMAKLSGVEQEMIALEANTKALEKLNAALQERVRQSEATAISGEGAAQGLRETCRALQRELDASKEALDGAEEKLEVAGRVNEEVEAALKVSLEQERVKEAQVRSLLEGQRSSAAEVQALRNALVEKEREVAQRTAELGAIAAQSKDITAAFHSLQEHFHTISAGSEDVAQRDQTIAALNTQKESLEQQLAGLKEERNKLLAKMDQLQQDKARLQGELEVARSSDMEEFRKAVQGKAVIESELSMAKLTYQQEVAKGQKRVGKLETELKLVKDGFAEREKEYHRVMQEREHELARVTGEHTRSQDELQKMREQLGQVEQGKQAADLALQRAEEQMETLRGVNDSLSKNNRDLLGQLQQEVAQRSEVERASGLVTLKVKQNAEERERRLQEQVGGLTLEVERLRGRLSGISTAQLCMRDHAGALEAALATKESSLVKLSAQTQKALEEKEEEEHERVAAILQLEQSVEALKEELQKTKEKAAAERREAAEAAQRLEQKVAEIREQHGEEVESLRGKMEQVVRGREELQVEVGELRVQVVTARTAADMAKQDWASKSSQVEVLQKELEGAKAHWKQAQEEAQRLRDQLRTREEQHVAELEVARRPLVESTPLRRGPSSNDMSTTGSTEETDTSGLTPGLCILRIV